jgi:hypothetical protein
MNMSLLRKRLKQRRKVTKRLAKKYHSRTKVGIEDKRIQIGWAVRYKRRKSHIHPRGGTAKAFRSSGAMAILAPAAMVRIPTGTRATAHFRICSD